MNQCEVLGTLTRDIEIKYTQGGVAIASFGIACNDKWKDQNGQLQEKAHFFDCTSFGKQAETLNQYFRKGSRILISGSLDFQSWTDQNGGKRSKVGIKVNKFYFIDRKADSQQQGQQQQPQATPQNNMDNPNYHNQSGAMNRPAQHQQPQYQQQQQQRQEAQPLPQVNMQEEEIPFNQGRP